MSKSKPYDPLTPTTKKPPIETKRTYSRQDSECRTYFLASAFTPWIGRWMPSAILSVFSLLFVLGFAFVGLWDGKLQESLAPGGLTRNTFYIFCFPAFRLITSLLWRAYCKRTGYGLEVQLLPNIAPSTGGTYRQAKKLPGYRVRYRGVQIESGKIEEGTISILTSVSRVEGSVQMTNVMTFISLRSKEDKPFRSWFPSSRAFENGWYLFMRRDFDDVANVYSHAKELVEYLDLPRGYVPQLVEFESEHCRRKLKHAFREGIIDRPDFPPL